MRVAPILAFLLLVAACAGAPAAARSDKPPSASPEPVRESPLRPEVPEIYTSEVEIGTSVEGRAIEMHVLGRGEEVVLVLAGIHGNERACTPLAEALVADLRRKPAILRRRTVLVVPNANPDGRVANTRRNANAVDLNRNFRASNRRDGRGGGRRALSEPEAQAIERLVRIYEPVRVLSLHQPLACVDYDGPAQALAERVAAACELPVRKLGTRPGSMGAWLGTGLGLPLITLELPRDAGEARSPKDLWRRYGAAFLEFVD